MIYLISAFIGAVITFAIEIGKKDEMLLYKYGQYIDGKFWLKPFGGCMFCTTFWIGILAYFSLNYNILEVPLLILFTGCLSVYILNKYIL